MEHVEVPRCHGVNREGEPCGAFLEICWQSQDFDEPALYSRCHQDQIGN